MRCFRARRRFLLLLVTAPDAGVEGWEGRGGCLGAGEQKGRWRWGEMKGEDSGDQFYLGLTRARPDMQERDEPEGRKRKERREKDGES